MIFSTEKRKHEVRPPTTRGPSVDGRGPRGIATPPTRRPSSSPACPPLPLVTVRFSSALRSSISISSSISSGAALRSEQREAGAKRQP